MKCVLCNVWNETCDGLSHSLCICVVYLPDAASKHAVQAFFDCLRAEVEEYGIVVSTISHTFINVSEPEPLAPVEQRPKPNFLTECE